MKAAVVFVGGILAASLSACYAKAGEHTVYDYVGTPYVSFDQDQKMFNHAFGRIRLDISEKSITSGDAVLPLEICGDQDPFYCLLGGEVIFAVPRRGSTGDSWSYKGYDFHDLGKQTLSIMGVSREVDVITAQHHGDTNPKEIGITYYSRKYGLLGFSVQYTEQDVIKTYFSNSGFGYGGSSD